MKKIIALFAIVSVFGFVACNNAAETQDATEENVENAEAESLLDEATEAVDSASTEAIEEEVNEATDAVEEITE